MRWYVQASLDQVSAARAAFYPSFDLRAFAGFDTLHTNELWHRSSRQLNLIPGVSLPLFDSGRLNANLATARGQSNTLVAQYNEMVFQAIKEVAQRSIESACSADQKHYTSTQTFAQTFATRTREPESDVIRPRHSPKET